MRIEYTENKPSIHAQLAPIFDASGVFVGQCTGDVDDEYGEPAVIVDPTLGNFVIPTYKWTKPVKMFNPYNPEVSKRVSPKLASLIIAAHLMSRYNLNDEMMEIFDKVRSRIRKMDYDAYMKFVD